MKYAVEIASYSMIHVPHFMNISTGIQAILEFCLKFERLKCWYY
jgi:hypothetical protein